RDGDWLIGERLVDLFPALVRVGGHLAVDRHLGGDRLVDMDGLEREVALVGACGEDNTVKTDLDLEDLLHTGLVAGLDLASLDATRGVGDVDRILTDTLTELTQATARSAGTDHRRLEIRERVAELFRYDAGEGK